MGRLLSILISFSFICVANADYYADVGMIFENPNFKNVYILVEPRINGQKIFAGTERNEQSVGRYEAIACIAIGALPVTNFLFQSLDDTVEYLEQREPLSVVIPVEGPEDSLQRFTIRNQVFSPSWSSATDYLYNMTVGTFPGVEPKRSAKALYFKSIGCRKLVLE
jgi:hypothetical protein